MTIPELLTVPEVAARLRCCQKHVRGLIKQGIIIAYRDSRRLLIDAASVEQYLKNRQVSKSHE